MSAFAPDPPKLCKDCKHGSWQYNQAYQSSDWFCTHHELVDLVTGEPRSCVTVRYGGGRGLTCGTNGFHWQAKEDDQ